MTVADTLPVLRNPGELTADELETTLARIEATLPKVDDLETLREWENQAEALWRYLRSRDLHKPVQAIQRKIEARIGQLLSPPQRGRARTKDPRRLIEKEMIPHSKVRQDYRYLGRALAGEVQLSDNEWQQGRDTLVRLIRVRLGEGEYAAKVGPVPTEKRRHKWQTPRGQGSRSDWLGNAVSNSSAAANLAYEMSDEKTVKQLTAEQCEKVLSEARRAVDLLECVIERIEQAR